MKIHQLTVAAALASLHTDPDGLGAAEAERRLREFGPNRVEPARVPGTGRRLARSFTHFFALILWLAAALAFVADWQQPGRGMATLGFAILGVILVNGLFSFWQEHRAEQAIAALQRLLPHEVKVVRDGRLTTRPATALVPGDIVLLAAGDDVPGDCRVLEAHGARVNNATITGESVALSRDERPSEAEGVLHARNVVLAGTSVVAGEIRAAVFATGMHTEFGRIAHLTQAARDTLSPLQRQIAHLSRWVALLATGLGILFFLVGRARGLSVWDGLLFGIGILVANVPEGLLPTVTLALAMGGQRMARRNALIRHLPSVETLGCATVILSDKTGTLTENRMQTREIFVDGRRHDAGAVTALAAGYPQLFAVARHCHDLKEAQQQGRNVLLGDPTEIALLEMARRAAPAAPTWARLDEIPFDAERRRLSTLHETPSGTVLYCKGALESLLPLSTRVETAAGPAALTPDRREALLAAEETLAARGLRVLALGYRAPAPGEARPQLERDLTLVGLVGLRDPPRPEVAPAITRCREAGIKVIMITGDHPQTALAIGQEIGLVHGEAARVITGERLRRLSDAELQLALDAPEILFARVDPDQKLRIVRVLQRKREIVAVTGDGVNDAPALRQADIGIAMGIAGTAVAREAAHMVLMDDNFASIVAAVEEGRAVYDNIRRFLTYILTSNIPEIVPYLAFVLFQIPLPLTVVQILAVDLGTDMLPALALGAELPGPDIMHRPPRPRAERLLSPRLLARAYGFLGMLEAAAAMAAFFFVLRAGGWHYGAVLGHDAPLYREATTACLSAIIVTQVVNLFLCRRDRPGALFQGLRHNPLIFWGLATEITLILLIDYTPWGQRLFGTAPIAYAAWLSMLPYAGLMLGLEEARKALTGRGPGGHR